MTQSNRFLSALITSLPALVLGSLAVGFFRGQVFWVVYLLGSIFFILSSFAAGFFLPAWMKSLKIQGAWKWILYSGAAAWLATLLVFLLLNLTPLCVGQPNSTGTNSLNMCLFQTMATGLVYAPYELILLTLSSIFGGLFLRSRLRG